MSWTTNIQYKGTDICTDFICPHCKTQSHYDGYFANHIICPCKRIYKLATDIPIEEVSGINLMPLEPNNE